MKTTQLIYEAWKNSVHPLPYETSVEKREVELLDPINDKHYSPDADGACYLCGGSVTGGIPKNKLLKETFTDHSFAKSPSSDWICSGCAFTILTNPNRRQALRWFTFCAAETLTICNRQQFRDFLVSPPEPPFVLSATVSQKKHIAIKSAVSYSRDRYLANLEDETIDVNRQVITRDLDLIEALMGLGFSKTNISEMNLSRKTEPELTTGAISELIDLISQAAKDRTFALAIYAAQEKTQEESECYMDSQLTTKSWRKVPKSSTPSIEVGTKAEDHQESTCGHKLNGSSGQVPREQLTLEDLLTASNEEWDAEH